MTHSYIFDLQRFNGGAAGGAGGGSGAGDGAASGGAQPGQEATPAAGEQVTKTPEQMEADFKALISGEYKDQFTKETQRIIDRRFRQARTTQEQLQGQIDSHRPIIDLLAARYGVEDGDVGKIQQALESDSAVWERAADDAGMTVEQYRQMQRLELENRRLREAQRQTLQQKMAQQQLARWHGESEDLAKDYPGFSLETEMQNPAFQSMLRAGVSMRNAYESLHMEDIRDDISKKSAKKMADTVRANGSRPSENGGSSGVSYTTDPAKMTKAQREDLARRAMRGEVISFGK